MRHVTREDLTLAPEEVRDFLSNAQLALLEQVSDDKIPAVYYAKNKLVSLFQNSLFSKDELACVLLSTAYELYGEKHVPTDPLNARTVHAR